ncbi:hypothetical protein Q3G72_033237 [Acer saccharum]|nr:hypothetical protein Q3G72_033237 [Acer saccharum]
MAIFTKTLSSSDIDRRLTIPGDCASEFPPIHEDRRIELNVIDESGCPWIFHFARQPATNSGIVISSGWPQFVKKKGLKVGDQIIFSKCQDEAGGQWKYKIDCNRC